MEEEEKEAQSAKLQELIRRGSPEDLQEANRLMKVMAGYDTRSKVDYRAKAAEEVSKIQAKARLLEERLEGFKPGDKMTDGDVFSELASALSSAQPKIQKMCEEESDDHAAVAKLLEINDSIHRTVERYRLMKKGDIEGANNIAKGGPLPIDGSSAGGTASRPNELSLIDFDGDADNGGGEGGGSAANASTNRQQQQQQQQQQGDVANDLLGLSLDEPNSYGQSGSIALGFGANTSIPGPALLSSLTHNSTSVTAQASSSPLPRPGNAFSSLPALSSGSQSSTPQPLFASQSISSPPPSQPAPPPVDPFSSLTSASWSARQSPAPPPPPASAAAHASLANEDDGWSFSSALPPDATVQPREHRLVVSNTSLRIDLTAHRKATMSNAIYCLFTFTNNTAHAVSELHFQVAVMKVGFLSPLSTWQTCQALRQH
jgi:ADP-ribosylation factor-binding protein GGA